MNLRLTRFKFYPPCIIGRLETIDGFTAYTLEPPEREKKPHCVPAGTYKLIPYDSPSHGQTWCLHNPALHVYAGMDGFRESGAPDSMDFVELHIGNFPSDSEGCILVGSSWSNGPAVDDSFKAVNALRKYLGAMSEGHTIEITERVD